MRTDEFQGFSELMQGVHEFYGKDCSGFTLDVWWAALKPYPLETVADAVNRHCVNPDAGQWMPKPADIIRMVDGSTVDAANNAWTKVEKALSAVGTYSSVVFDDALIHRVVADMCGWVGLGAKRIDEWPFVRNEFITRYRGYLSRRENPEYPRKLIGITDAENVKNGFKSVAPILLGNADKAQSVFAKGSEKPLLAATRFSEDVLMLEAKGAA